QSLVSRQAVGRVLRGDDLRGVTLATLLGAASSSCSYPAGAVGRGLFRKGATFAHAILCELASTTLVCALGPLPPGLPGWQGRAHALMHGSVLAGAMAARGQHKVWQSLLISGNPTVAAVSGPFIGPVIAMVSFVCSVGNLALAVVLWSGGVSFRGVGSFIFGD